MIGVFSHQEKKKVNRRLMNNDFQLKTQMNKTAAEREIRAPIHAICITVEEAKNITCLPVNKQAITPKQWHLGPKAHSRK